MDASLRDYLDCADGSDAQIWVPPSRGQLFWLRHAPALFGPPVHGGNRFARWWAIATVTPSTNVTGLNLPYQAYLNLVFHRTRLARIGHAVCMPVIVAAVLAACCPLRLGPVNASLPVAAALALWWLVWSAKERDPWWGVSCLVLAAVLYAVANLGYALRPGGASLATQPMVWALVGSLLQAASHIAEPLPPRVSRSTHWIGVRKYVWGSRGHRHPAATVLRRCGHLAAQTVFGTVDELVASPRLLPVLLLQVLWRAGHAGHRGAALRALASGAIASGNPALDYIGTGGAAPLRFITA